MYLILNILITNLYYNLFRNNENTYHFYFISLVWSYLDNAITDSIEFLYLILRLTGRGLYLIEFVCKS